MSKAVQKGEDYVADSPAERDRAESRDDISRGTSVIPDGRGREPKRNSISAKTKGYLYSHRLNRIQPEGKVLIDEDLTGWKRPRGLRSAD